MHQFIQEMRATIRKRFPHIYLSAFLCCHQSKLDKELAQEHLHDKLAPFLEQFEKVMHYMESRKRMYYEGTIPFEDEQLRPLLIKMARLCDSVHGDLAYSTRKLRGSVKLLDLVKINILENQVGKLKQRSKTAVQRKG